MIGFPKLSSHGRIILCPVFPLRLIWTRFSLIPIPYTGTGVAAYRQLKLGNAGRFLVNSDFESARGGKFAWTNVLFLFYFVFAHGGCAGDGGGEPPIGLRMIWLAVTAGSAATAKQLCLRRKKQMILMILMRP